MPTLKFFFILVLLLIGCKTDHRQTVPTSRPSSDDLWTRELDSTEEASKRKGEREHDVEIAIEHLNDVLADSAQIDHFEFGQFLTDSIPHDIFKLKHLRRLSITFTYLKEIPEDVCDLTDLEELRLDRNKLESTRNVGCLKGLSRLSLMGNKLTAIEGLGELDKLQYLNISNNDFSGGINSEFPKKLEELILDNSKLKSFPLSILCLNELTRLHLINNKELIHIPVEISKMKRLNELVLDGTSVQRGEVLKLAGLMPWCKIYKDESRQAKPI